MVVRLRAASPSFLDIAGPGPGSGGWGMEDWAVGDRVIPRFLPDWRDGTLWHAVRAARLGPHSTALLPGTGGMSIFAL